MENTDWGVAFSDKYVAEYCICHEAQAVFYEEMMHWLICFVWEDQHKYKVNKMLVGK